MIKSLVAAVALTIGLAGYAVAQESAHRHHHHHRHHHMLQPGPSAFPQPESSDYVQPGPSAYVQPGPSADGINPSIYWSPAGGDPTHYAQTSGFYAGGH
jgi:hypothetical protein